MKKTDKIPSREQGMSEKVKYCQKVVRAGNKLAKIFKWKRDGAHKKT